MTEQTKSYASNYRIRNYEDELATVWQIGNGDFFAVKFDRDIEPVIYSKEDVANAFNKLHWEIAAENESMKEESLPRTFKFKCRGYEDFIYTFTQGEGYSCEEYSVGPVEYSTKDAIKNIQDGHWIVLPSEDTTVLPSEPEIYSTSSQNVPFDGYTAKLHNQEEYLPKDLIDKLHKFGEKFDIIQRIKSATQNYDMTISIDGGCYHIYDNTCDISYRADTDEKLIEILDCIDFLSGCVDGN